MLSLELVMSVFLFNRSFEFDPETSCYGCTKDTRVNIINIGLQVDMTHIPQKFDDCPIQNRLLGFFCNYCNHLLRGEFYTHSSSYIQFWKKWYFIHQPLLTNQNIKMSKCNESEIDLILQFFAFFWVCHRDIIKHSWTWSLCSNRIVFREFSTRSGPCLALLLLCFQL